MHKPKFSLIRPKLFFLLSVVILFLFRLFIITSAHHGDLNNNISWGTIAYEKGLNGFYEGKGLAVKEDGQAYWPYSAPNQPPLYILLFTFFRFAWQHIRNFIWYMNWEVVLFPSRMVWFWDEKGMDVMAKLPSLLADLGIGLLIYGYFKNKNKERTGIILSMVWLINPLSWYNSTIWGQTDTIVNFLGLWSVISLLDRKLSKFSILFSLSILFKPSLVVFIPILLIVLLKQKYNSGEVMRALLLGFLTVTAVTLPFHPYPDLYFWLVYLYIFRIMPGEIGYLTANAFNFWWIVNPGKVLDSDFILGLPAKMWGYLMSFSLIAILIAVIRKPLKEGNVFIGLGLSSLITFMFMTRIHERYNFPFFPMATIYLGYSSGYWPIYLVLSLVSLVNEYNLFWGPSIPWLERNLSSQWHGIYLSILNLVLLAVTFIYVYRKKSIIKSNEI